MINTKYSRYLLYLFLLLLILMISSSFPVYGQDGLVVGNPNIDVVAPENRVDLGEKTSLDIFLNNKGNINIGGPLEFEREVTTARGTIVELKKGDAPIEIKTSKRPVGNIQEGINGPFSFTIEVKQNGEPGKYRIPLDIEYKHTRLIRHGEDFLTTRTTSTKTTTKYITLIIEEKPQFEIIDSKLNLTIGNTGTATIKIKNNGFQTAYNSFVTAKSEDIQLRLGNEGSISNNFGSVQNELIFQNLTQRSYSYTGDWREGETKIVKYKFSLRDDAIVRNYPISLRVNYENRNGIKEKSESMITGIYPSPKSSFLVRSLYSDLTLDKEGELGGTIINNGDNIIRESVVVLEASNVFSFDKKEFPIGDFFPGMSKEFYFNIQVPKTANIGPNRFSLYIESKDPQGNIKNSKKINIIGNIEPKKNDFILNTYNPSFEVNSEGILFINVTNNRNETYKDITLDLNTNTETISSDDKTSFIEKLNSSQTESISFHIDVSDDAISKKTPIPLFIEYEDKKGVRRNNTYYISINVVEKPGPNIPIIESISVIIASMIAIFWWLKRKK